MKAFKCIICGRDKQGAVVCYPCRCACNRMLEYGLDPLEVYIVMVWPKHRVNFGGLKLCR